MATEKCCCLYEYYKCVGNEPSCAFQSLPKKQYGYPRYCHLMSSEKYDNGVAHECATYGALVRQTAADKEAHIFHQDRRLVTHHQKTCRPCPVLFTDDTVCFFFFRGPSVLFFQFLGFTKSSGSWVKSWCAMSSQRTRDSL